MIRHAIDGSPLMPAAESMLMTGMFVDGPGSTTPHLSWRTPSGELLRQHGCREQGRIRFAPSNEFAALLDRLLNEWAEAE